MSQLTPMVEQYMAVKNQHKDELLFFRLGDFYEMFNDDALIASRELNLTLTKRSNSNGSMPMCGVPYHAADMYIKRLIDLGHKVAVCEQLTDPSESKGIVIRDVIRVVTPGTLTDSSMLDDGRNNYICSAFYDEETKTCSIASADVSTGELNLTQIDEKNPAAKIVILTSFGGSADLQQTLASGALGAQLKESRMDNVLKAVRAVSRGESAVDPEIQAAIDAEPPHLSLTPRQLETLKAAAIGKTTDQIATACGISASAVKQHITAIMRNLGVSSRSEAIAVALSRNLLKI